jgi:hypothetical protein
VCVRRKLLCCMTTFAVLSPPGALTPPKFVLVNKTTVKRRSVDEESVLLAHDDVGRCDEGGVCACMCFHYAIANISIISENANSFKLLSIVQSNPSSQQVLDVANMIMQKQGSGYCNMAWCCCCLCSQVSNLILLLFSLNICACYIVQNVFCC